MLVTKSRFECLSTTFIVVGVLMWMLSCADIAGADIYSDSAHGDASVGVHRSTATCENWPGEQCVTGSCAHCHDTFDPDICQNDVNGLMLFAPNDNPTSQTDNFCFQCHSGNGTYCYREAGIGSCTATWRPTINMTANYNVYAWWVDGPNRATNAPYTIYYADMETSEDCYPVVIVSETVRVNQQANGGQWNLLGTYPFADGTSGYVVLSDDANDYVVADAIKWEFDSYTPCYDTVGDPPSFDFVVDNLTAEFVCDWTCVDHASAHPGGVAGSVQAGGIVNNEYGATFGGGAPKFDSVYDAFNPLGTWASSHDLSEVQSYARGKSWGEWMTAGTNACLVCHDQHLSQKNFPVEIYDPVNGGVKTAVRRGNDVISNPGDLWGDEPASVSGRNEMMSDWASGYTYQAPYRGDSGYEPGPAGSTVQGGSNLPNFVDACTETCHSQAINGCEAVNWTTDPGQPGTPSAHGRAAANNAAGDWGWLKPPYSDSLRGSYVLSCTDCHEPHGSSNATLLRTTVNGVSGLTTGNKGGVVPDGGYWYYWCQACHDLTYNFETGEGHMVIWPEARCGDSIGCHLRTDGDGGDHGYQF